MDKVKLDYRERNRRLSRVLGSVTEVAIVFIDLKDSTPAKDDLGPGWGIDKVVDFVIDVADIAKKKKRDFAREHPPVKVVIAKYIGDAVMLYVRGDRARHAAVEIAVAIQRHFEDRSSVPRLDIAKFKPRIGIDYGEVRLAKLDPAFPPDPYGSVVDRAARIAALAKPQQILASYVIKPRGNPSNSSFGASKKRYLRGFHDSTSV